MAVIAYAELNDPRETFWRSLQTLNITRIVIALVLLIYLSFSNKGFSTTGQLIYAETCVAYLLAAVAFAIFKVYYRKRFLLHLSIQITVDIATIAVLYFVGSGAKSGLAILFLYPLAGAAILAPLLLALFFAAIVSLFLLGESWYQVYSQDVEASTMQAGMYGGAFFAMVFVVNRLAAKLIRQEELATQRGNDLQIQQAINRLVISDMGDGIVVVGQDSGIFTCNPAAESMLGLFLPLDKKHFRLTDFPALHPIAEAYFEWDEEFGQQGAIAASAASYASIKRGDHMLAPGGSSLIGGRRDFAVHLKLRFAKVETAGLVEARSVIFLQDVSDIENKAQQLKLASMGRLTASIAHEVRNPLSAISHAAALLDEEFAGATQQRLLSIVRDNVARVNRMIEDILQLSRKVQPNAEPVAALSFLIELQRELEETGTLPPGVLTLYGSDEFLVRFDSLHLHEVITNLLTNAVRYASGKAGSIQMQFMAGMSNRIELHVHDDGPGITPEVRAHLFEPFYTTSSKGTGLGLYLARELCLNNGAMLDYEYRMESLGDGADEATGRFVITFSVSDSRD